MDDSDHRGRMPDGCQVAGGVGRRGCIVIAGHGTRELGADPAHDPHAHSGKLVSPSIFVAREINTSDDLR